MSQDERRRHVRYLLHLPIKIRHEGRELGADVINASAGGCLLRVAEPFASGAVIEASIPELKIPSARLIVTRCHSTPTGYTVATHFEALLADDALIRQLADDQQDSPEPRVLH